jgi:hypothetical protein
MSDYCLDALGVSAPGAAIVVEGSFTGNPWFAPLLAALRHTSKSAAPTTVAAPHAARGYCTTGSVRRPAPRNPPRRPR